jgi:hypothetical protein
LLLLSLFSLAKANLSGSDSIDQTRSDQTGTENIATGTGRSEISELCNPRIVLTGFSQLELNWCLFPDLGRYLRGKLFQDARVIHGPRWRAGQVRFSASLPPFFCLTSFGPMFFNAREKKKKKKKLTDA